MKATDPGPRHGGTQSTCQEAILCAHLSGEQTVRNPSRQLPGSKVGPLAVTEPGVCRFHWPWFQADFADGWPEMEAAGAASSGKSPTAGNHGTRQEGCQNS